MIYVWADSAVIFVFSYVTYDTQISSHDTTSNDTVWSIICNFRVRLLKLITGISLIEYSRSWLEYVFGCVANNISQFKNYQKIICRKINSKCIPSSTDIIPRKPSLSPTHVKKVPFHRNWWFLIFEMYRVSTSVLTKCPPQGIVPIHMAK